MQKILLVLQRVYGNPVDIEYAVNMDSGCNAVYCIWVRRENTSI